MKLPFDLANNNSPMSETLSTQTITSPANAPLNLTATPFSATEVTLAWSPPLDSSGVVILTHLAFNRQAKRANVLIIDEPELSLHLRRQELFVDSV